MDKVYTPHEIERRIYAEWESKGWFAPRRGVRPYCIMIPPPNVTGTLHMGHAFQHTLMDALTRVHRMEGRRTLWQPGTDHAGIATQMVVERQLNQQGEHRVVLGRAEFVARGWGRGGGSAGRRASDGGRASAQPAGRAPRRARARGVRRARVALERRIRRNDRTPDAQARRIGRLVARPLHDGRRPLRRSRRSVRPAVPGRPDLPRPAARQLGPCPAYGALRPRGRG